MENIIRYELIYGSRTPILQGKTTRVKPKGSKIEIIPRTLPISQHLKDLQFYIELFFVNGYPFLATKTNNVNFITSKPCISRKIIHITKYIITFLDLYEARGFNITSVCGDNKFNIKTLKSHFLPICTHIYGKGEHVDIIKNGQP